MNQPDRYTCYTVTVPNEACDILADFITESFDCGVELVDIAESNGASASSALRFYVASEDSSTSESSLRDFLKSHSVADPHTVEIGEIRSKDWEEAYRQSVKAERVGEGILVHPTWVTPNADDLRGIESQIILDPQMAFGTGSHGTTRLCMLELNRVVFSGAKVADVGCGSGILAILAAKRGAKSAIALDIDPIAVENTIENSELNGVSNKIEATIGSADKLDIAAYDIVVANIILGPLLELLPQLNSALKIDGTLILSGLLEADSAEIELALASVGLIDWRKNAMDEWRSYTVQKSQ